MGAERVRGLTRHQPSKGASVPLVIFYGKRQVTAHVGVGRGGGISKGVTVRMGLARAVVGGSHTPSAVPKTGVV